MSATSDDQLFPDVRPQPLAGSLVYVVVGPEGDLHGAFTTRELAAHTAGGARHVERLLVHDTVPNQTEVWAGYLEVGGRVHVYSETRSTGQPYDEPRMERLPHTTSGRRAYASSFPTAEQALQVLLALRDDLSSAVNQ